MAEKQKNGEIISHYDLSTVKPETIQRAYTRMKKEQEISDEE